MNPKINLDSFLLPFMDESIGEPEDESEDYPEPSAVLEKMEDAIPKKAKFIGVFEDEVNNWTSWKIEDHFYVIPWQDDEFDWALFRISWDDNHGRYDWDCCARVSGITEYKAAARFMVKELYESWGYDLKKEENERRKEFIEEI